MNHVTKLFFTWALVALSAAAIDSVRADDWGTLKGRFVFDGKPPATDSITVTKDQEFCGKPPALVDESLVVGDKGGLANVLVWLRTKNPKVHPDYAKTATDKAVIDNSHCRFDPHIVTMRVGQPLVVKNSDMIAHNTNAALMVNSPFNQVIPANESADEKVESAETLPVGISCNIHGWMKGWLLVRPDPYSAVSNKDGSFEIKNLPAGTELEFQVWQEKAGNLAKASVGGKDAGWKNGRFKFTIKPGDNDLGEIKLDPGQFDK